MTVARLEHWIQLLPAQERIKPCLIVDGKQLTPMEMLREAQAGSELGRKAQALWEGGALGTARELLVDRVKQMLSRYPQDKPIFHVLGAPNLLTPKDILANIEAGTKTGEKWLDNERRVLEYYDRLRERV